MSDCGLSVQEAVSLRSEKILSIFQWFFSLAPGLLLVCNMGIDVGEIARLMAFSLRFKHLCLCLAVCMNAVLSSFPCKVL